MSNLFNITGDMIALRNQIEGESEFAEESEELVLLEEKLTLKQEELSTKVEGYLHVISQSEAQADMGIKELERIQAFIDKKKHVAERLTASLLQALLLFGEEDSRGIKRLELGTHKLSTRRSTSVKILNPEMVENDCKQFDVKFKNLTPDLKDALEKILNENPNQSGLELINSSDTTTKISKTLVKAKLATEEIDWAEIETKYGLTIK